MLYPEQPKVKAGQFWRLKGRLRASPSENPIDDVHLVLSITSRADTFGSILVDLLAVDGRISQLSLYDVTKIMELVDE